MLVLARKRNEAIVINDNVVISVVEIRGDKVRLGIDAPREVPVNRQEVYDAIKKNGKSKVLAWRFVSEERRWEALSFFGDELNRESWSIEVSESGQFTIMPSDFAMMAGSVSEESETGDSLAEAKRKCNMLELSLQRYMEKTGAEINSLIALRDQANEEIAEMEAVS